MSKTTSPALRLIAAAVAGYAAELQSETADRKPHARYLEALLAADYDDLDEVPVPSGVSAQIAFALVEDVVWIKRPSAYSRFPHSYSYGRVEARRASARRAKNANSWRLP